MFLESLDNERKNAFRFTPSSAESNSTDDSRVHIDTWPALYAAVSLSHIVSCGRHWNTMMFASLTRRAFSSMAMLI